MADEPDDEVDESPAAIAFANFLAALDPGAVERERFTPPSDGERPWSRGDLEMRHAHQYLVADYWRIAARIRRVRADRERHAAAHRRWAQRSAESRAGGNAA